MGCESFFIAIIHKITGLFERFGIIIFGNSKAVRLIFGHWTSYCTRVYNIVRKQKRKEKRLQKK